MKHEALVRALSEIDERFIEEAHGSAPAARGRMPFIRGLCAAAACLLLCCIVIMQMAGGTRVMLFGEELQTGKSVTLSERLPGTARLLPGESTVSIPLEVRPAGKVTLAAADGSLTVTDESTGETLYEGNSYELTRDALVVWQAELDDREKTFEMNITERNRSSTLLLRFDSAAGDWTLTINKTENGEKE